MAAPCLFRGEAISLAVQRGCKCVAREQSAPARVERGHECSSGSALAAWRDAGHDHIRRSGFQFRKTRDTISASSSSSSSHDAAGKVSAESIFEALGASLPSSPPSSSSSSSPSFSSPPPSCSSSTSSPSPSASPSPSPSTPSPSQPASSNTKKGPSQHEPSVDANEPQWRNAFPAYMQSKEDNKSNNAFRGESMASEHAMKEPPTDSNANPNSRSNPKFSMGPSTSPPADHPNGEVNAAVKAAKKAMDEDVTLVTPASSAAQPPVTAGTSLPKLIDDDPVWAAIRAEARLEAEREPLLSSFLYASILAHSCFERSLGFVLANRLKNATLLATQLLDVFDDVLTQESIRHAIRADVQAVKDRDPSCRSYSSALLYYKGYHALQSYRIAHALWKRGQKVLALALQSRISEVFAVDIHPAARIGYGILMDHGTGVVIGETAVVRDRVSMLQGVTLGGTGKEAGDRHPKIHEGVLIGAGATVLGNIVVGRGAMVAAGSLVLKNVPPHSMVAGTPAKVVGMLEEPTPALTMKHDATKDFCVQWEDAVRRKAHDEFDAGSGI